jgi:hypothetical protein
LNLNIVFQVPGNLAQPDFLGVRTGHYAKNRALLIVQVALPEIVPDEPSEYLRSATEAAISEAERWASSKGLAESLPALRQIIQEIS